jgi:glycine hydroxymethyltransferase
MGMNLLHGGHLSHGSPVNRSGKYYNAIHYTVDSRSEQIDYDQVEELARQHKPKFIIAGYSSYPWTVDWSRFRQIASAVGAYLFADIAHVAGLVVAGEYPSPVGYADVITFTTHKSLCGPRGACILTFDPTLARRIDRAVFPGEQGGPHVNVFAAIALTFKLAKTEQFYALQRQVVKNCVTFTERLKEHGFRIPYGGTNTHLMNLDCGWVKAADGSTLSGDQAARILDIAGIVVNRNTIPGDRSAVDPSGIRMGTPWVTQRGFRENEMIALADIIVDLLKATAPFRQTGSKGGMRRARVDFDALESARLKVRDLAEGAGMDFTSARHGYPHFYYIDEQLESEWSSFEIEGEKSLAFLNFALASDVEDLSPGQTQATCLYPPQDAVDGSITMVGKNHYRLRLPSDKSGLAITWLRDLSDGFIRFGDDLLRKLPGPVIIGGAVECSKEETSKGVLGEVKPYIVNGPAQGGKALPDFTWNGGEGELRRTPVYDTHKKRNAKIIPFAGWEMPVWYTSVLEEHQAVRQAAGLFDVAHMGVYQVEGAEAAIFLDSVVGNDIGRLEIGESCYTQFLDPDAEVIDDLLVYRREAEKFLVVVNAANDEKDWAWLNGVKDGSICVSNERPWARAFGRKATLRNLRDPNQGADMRVDIALQGPRSRDILLNLDTDERSRKRILALKRTQLCEANLCGFDLVISRTGYTGEKMAFELFVHPDRANELFQTLLKIGEPLGLKPIGLGSRDSLRIESGLPLYGHEMGVGSGKMGHEDLGVAEAGFGSYVKTYKPWFIGREAYLEKEKRQVGIVVRFRINEKGVRIAHGGDPVMDRRGRVIGWVTSCSVDVEGLLVGQAFVDRNYAQEGNPLYIYQGAPEKTGAAPADLRLGDKSILPAVAAVVSRFPK